MKTTKFIAIALFTFVLTSCDKNIKTASIKDNSNKVVVKEEKHDYSDIPSANLYKHTVAHYDLGQFKIGVEKLKYLIKDRPDLIDSLNLNTLKAKFDSKLKLIKQKEDSIADLQRKLRMPNATKNMRVVKKKDFDLYVDNSSPKFDSKETFHIYYTKNKSGVVELHLKIKYIDTDWLNIESFMVTVDQLDYDFSGDVVKTETHGKKKYKEETLDKIIDTEKELLLLETIANGQTAKAVYIGKSTYKEREITKQQQIAFRNVIDAYLFTIKQNMTQLKQHYASQLK